MRYFTYNQPDADDPKKMTEVTLSELDILGEHWVKWYQLMCEELGEETVNENYTQEDCIIDWVIMHAAWENTGQHGT